VTVAFWPSVALAGQAVMVVLIGVSPPAALLTRVATLDWPRAAQRAQPRLRVRREEEDREPDLPEPAGTESDLTRPPLDPAPHDAPQPWWASAPHSAASSAHGRPSPEPDTEAHPLSRPWRPGDDVHHPEHGHGWVQGAGHGRVTVRFETRSNGPGRARTLPADDPALIPADPLDSLL